MLGWGGCIAFRFELPCTSLFRFRMLLTPSMFLQLNYWESSNSIPHQIAEKHVFNNKKITFHLPNEWWSVRQEISFDCSRDQIQEEEKRLFCFMDLYSSLSQRLLQVPTITVCGKSSSKAPRLQSIVRCCLWNPSLYVRIVYYVYKTLNDNIKPLVCRFLNPCRN